ncbi:hypothetical protein [Methylocaldum sp.]|uniref:hypothetical protein n=1 Tax=Methylocaldum sp. TaxID=1969727 RepID=UPI002D44BEB4|nr:hypothetical protein [Methylocaldum sp.]HYE36844.1 hypothetical protein [Methylocaldum sp.]
MAPVVVASEGVCSAVFASPAAIGSGIEDVSVSEIGADCISSGYGDFFKSRDEASASAGFAGDTVGTSLSCFFSSARLIFASGDFFLGSAFSRFSPETLGKAFLADFSSRAMAAAR